MTTALDVVYYGRQAFYNALANDVVLNGLGLKDDESHPTILNNYSKEEKPSHITPFIILRWGPTPRLLCQDGYGYPDREIRDEDGKLIDLIPDTFVKAPEPVTVWVHYPKGVSGDFNDIVAILDRIDWIARGLRDVPETAVVEDETVVVSHLNFVVIGDRSGDLDDDGFQTITKWANYEIHSRKG